MRLVFSFASLALLAAAASANAQNLRWHAGLGIATELDQRGPNIGGEIDADSAATLFVGATHASGFGAELSYVDLGRLREAGIADGGFETNGELWSLGLTYAVKLDAFEPYAKLGWFTREEDGSANTIAGPRPLQLDDDGWTGEVGLRWRVTEPVALRLGYVWYDFDPESDGSAQFAAEWHF